MSTAETPTPKCNEQASSTPRLAPAIPDHELVRRIGSGNYGEVWLARNIMGTHRAVKIVYRSTFEEERPYEREFAGLQKFEPISRSHESQLNILQVGRNDTAGYFYYVMELADDVSTVSSLEFHASGSEQPQPLTSNLQPETYLPKTLKSEIRRRGRLRASECIEIALALTTALAHLHKNGLVHRDIKPSNIIYVNGRPKLADIGLVTGVDATRSYVGTEGFAPPEGPGSAQADIYALGKVLYEMSTGRDRQEFPELPTRLGENESTEMALLELNEVGLKACQLEPRRRYQTAEAMSADLQFLERGKSLAQKRVRQRRVKVLAQAGGVAVGLAAIVAVINEIRYGRQEAKLTATYSDLVSRRSPNAQKQPQDEIPDLSRQLPTFDIALRSRAEQFPRLQVNREVGKCAFIQVRLNQRPIRWENEYLDAIRFTAPDEKDLDMVWTFVTPKVRIGWGIMLLDGSMERGFRNFFLSDAAHYKGVPEPQNKRMRVQGMPAKWLEPKQEYLITFKFTERKPVDFLVAINFVPTGICSETNRLSLERALGLVAKEDEPETARSRGPAQK